MTVIKCDKCKCEIKNVNKYLIESTSASLVKTITTKDYSIDLCDSCADKFENMIDVFLGRE